MDCSDLAPLRIAQQYGQAISHHHGASQTGLASHCTVRAQAIGRLRVNLQYVSAVYLVHEYRAHPHLFLQADPVAVH
jgi:hypothetical protein